MVTPLGAVATQMGDVPGVSDVVTISADVLASARERHPFLRDLRRDLFGMKRVE